MQDNKSKKPTGKSTPENPPEKGANDVISKISEKVEKVENILVALSKNPSVDELAAALGLTMFLDGMGKHATAIFSGKIPNALEFLKPEDTFEVNTNSLQDFIIALNKEKADHLRYKLDGEYVKVFITPYKTTLSEEDLEFSHGDFNVNLVIALNVPTIDDLDAALYEHGRIMHDATAVNITTEVPGKFGEIEWSDPGASSVSEMIVRLVNHMRDKSQDLPQEIATAFLTGIVAATERFSNSRTTPATMTIASRLMEAGADQTLISENVMKSGAVESNVIDATEAVAKGESADLGTMSVKHEEKPAEDPSVLRLTKNGKDGTVVDNSDDNKDRDGKKVIRPPIQSGIQQSPASAQPGTPQPPVSSQPNASQAPAQPGAPQPAPAQPNSPGAAKPIAPVQSASASATPAPSAPAPQPPVNSNQPSAPAPTPVAPPTITPTPTPAPAPAPASATDSVPVSAPAPASVTPPAPASIPATPPAPTPADSAPSEAALDNLKKDITAAVNAGKNPAAMMAPEVTTESSDTAGTDLPFLQGDEEAPAEENSYVIGPSGPNDSATPTSPAEESPAQSTTAPAENPPENKPVITPPPLSPAQPAPSLTPQANVNAPATPQPLASTPATPSTDTSAQPATASLPNVAPQPAPVTTPASSASAPSIPPAPVAPTASGIELPTPPPLNFSGAMGAVDYNPSANASPSLPPVQMSGVGSAPAVGTANTASAQPADTPSGTTLTLQPPQPADPSAFKIPGM